MKKLVLFLILSILITPVTFAGVIVGGIEYNKEMAKEEIFSKPAENISIDLIKSKYIDRECHYNLSTLRRGITKLSDREIAEFSDGTYGIMFYDEPEYYWFYSQEGKLVNFTKKSSLEYPIRITKYSTDGRIINTGLKVSKEESYIFSPNGKLNAHWKGNLCFDGDGNIIMVRKFIK